MKFQKTFKSGNKLAIEIHNKALREAANKLGGHINTFNEIKSKGIGGFAKDQMIGSLKSKIPARYRKVYKAIRNVQKGAEKAVKDTVRDAKSRAPGMVATSVTGVYNIKKSEIMPSSSKSGSKSRVAGTVRIEGESINNLSLIYTGRLLTPTHFGMKPKARPMSTKDTNGKVIKKARGYTVTAEIIKGQRKALGSNVFLGSNKGAGYIPFQRKGDGRLPINAVKTLSVPQMITNQTVAADIELKLQNVLEDRLSHNMKRHLGIK